jgi:RNA polymerase sigma-70 factor (ECF subfamily)
MAGGIRWHRVPREQRYQFDRAYLDRLAAGDPETEQHFTRYFGELLGIKLRSRLRSAALIDDVRQETFVRVLSTLRSPKGIGSPGGFGAFVNSVCNNVLFETYRAHGRVAPTDEDGPPDVADTRDDAETDVVRAEERAHVREILKTLPPKEQQLLHWLFFEECDKDEVCRRLNVDRDYLRVLLHRAKQRFKTEFVGG